MSARLIVIIFTCLACSTLVAKKPSICLNMIVKDEAQNIEKCLDSIKPLIDTWVIVDTGSRDDTQKRIQKCLKKIPGKLYQRPWVNFAHNRNEALKLVKDKTDYILTLDADEELIFSKDFNKFSLEKDVYFINIFSNETIDRRIFLFKNSSDWEWKGVIHESLISPQEKSHAILKGLSLFTNNTGCHARDPGKLENTILLLEDEVKKDPSNPRNQFYLAKSYAAANKPHLALATYKKRAQMDGAEDELFSSLYQSALIEQQLNYQPHIFLDSLFKAYHINPCRFEPLYHLALYYRNNNDYLLGYMISKHALSLPTSTDSLPTENWMKEYGLLMEYSLCAYYLGKYQEAKDACDRMLANPKLPDNYRSQIIANLTWIDSKLPQPKAS